MCGRAINQAWLIYHLQAAASRLMIAGGCGSGASTLITHTRRDKVGRRQLFHFSHQHRLDQFNVTFTFSKHTYCEVVVVVVVVVDFGVDFN